MVRWRGYVAEVRMRAHRDKADAKSRCSLSVRQASFICSRVGPEVSQEIAPPADPLLD